MERHLSWLPVISLLSGMHLILSSDVFATSWTINVTGWKNAVLRIVTVVHCGHWGLCWVVQMLLCFKAWRASCSNRGCRPFSTSPDSGLWRLHSLACIDTSSGFQVTAWQIKFVQ